jgi:glycosyltransferase involved in cell wall biosynthesis
MATTRTTRANESYTAGVVTLNREKLLMRCIRSLVHQDLPPGEIYIVDQGGSQYVQEGIRKLMTTYKKTVFTYVPMSVHNRATGRNHVLRNARYRYILFTDDDCVVRKDWATVAMRTLREGAAFVLGSTLMHPASRGYVAQLEYHYIQQFFSSYQYNLRRLQSYMLDTRNCAIDTQKALKYNITFNTDQHYLEDVDFSYQICQKGEKIAFEKAMVVYHQFRSNIVSALRVQFQMGFGIRRLDKRWSTNTQIKKINLLAYHKLNMRQRETDKDFNVLHKLFVFARWMGYCFGTIGG